MILDQQSSFRDSSSSLGSGLHSDDCIIRGQVRVPGRLTGVATNAGLAMNDEQSNLSGGAS